MTSEGSCWVLRQLLAGSRKFAVGLVSRDGIAALTPEAAKVSGIRYIMDVDREEAEAILDGKGG